MRKVFYPQINSAHDNIRHQLSNEAQDTSMRAMPTNHVEFAYKNFVATISIDRPQALNALNSKVLDELLVIINSMDYNNIRCVVITGAGTKAFVAGADITEMSSFSYKEAQFFSQKGNETFLAIERIPVPTIALINGYALGGGCELALACDLRYCSPSAIFAQPEASLGILPGFGGTYRLRRTVGLSKAKEMIFTGEKISADKALRIGLVNAIFSEEEIYDKVYNIASLISQNAPIAIRNAKKALEKEQLINIDDLICTENTLFASTFETEDRIEGMSAFIQKRIHSPFQNK